MYHDIDQYNLKKRKTSINIHTLPYLLMCMIENSIIEKEIVSKRYANAIQGKNTCHRTSTQYLINSTSIHHHYKSQPNAYGTLVFKHLCQSGIKRNIYWKLAMKTSNIVS